ncbi:DGQHR domain-containing protein [Hyalangium gracile]|uniref:DGQHR domain-containing protein n=1 Tax=Hyalangium gracile TaxID=394092 RepID=UPI001CCDC281|nr:DGQHR domain-containing protein [Hyalangium gracile]
MTKRSTRQKLESRTFYGFRVHQRDEGGKAFFVFATTARDVLAWSYVARVSEKEGGIQRRLNEAKVTSIARYFESDTENTIPTSTIVAFKPNVTKFKRIRPQPPQPTNGVEWGYLTFEFNPLSAEDKRPAFVVDGQHRLHGMSRIENEELPVLISALLDADPNEQAFQFIVINNKASKVPPDLVKSLIVDFDESNLNERLKTARVSLQGRASLVAIIDDDPESPLHQMVDWERRRGEGNPCIKPVALEGGLHYARRRLLALEDDDDAVIEFFFSLWHGVRDAYPRLWKKTDNNLFSNAGFRAFTEHLVDELDTLDRAEFVNISNPRDVRQTATKLSSQITPEFWTTEWTLKSLDTSAGREIIRKDLRRIRQNLKDKEDWSAGLAVLARQAVASE